MRCAIKLAFYSDANMTVLVVACGATAETCSPECIDENGAGLLTRSYQTQSWSYLTQSTEDFFFQEKRLPMMPLTSRWSVAAVGPMPTPKLISHTGDTFRSVTTKSCCCC